MLSGRQLYLLRDRKNHISDIELSKQVGLSVNDIIIYEYGIKPIPQDVYDKWIQILQ